VTPHLPKWLLRVREAAEDPRLYIALRSEISPMTTPRYPCPTETSMVVQTVHPVVRHIRQELESPTFEHVRFQVAMGIRTLYRQPGYGPWPLSAGQNDSTVPLLELGDLDRSENLKSMGAQVTEVARNSAMSACRPLHQRSSQNQATLGAWCTRCGVLADSQLCGRNHDQFNWRHSSQSALISVNVCDTEFNAVSRRIAHSAPALGTCPLAAASHVPKPKPRSAKLPVRKLSFSVSNYADTDFTGGRWRAKPLENKACDEPRSRRKMDWNTIPAFAKLGIHPRTVRR